VPFLLLILVALGVGVAAAEDIVPSTDATPHRLGTRTSQTEFH